ncbi:SARP family transcriptional regulator [Sphaerisporangium siamense]|uniref:DNA-binding SARP family transcriptional activator/Flp pilus assembly protein TadD n=1 Tax=Sphaerisporangium siamense TaxID=795645 RepID=A0A7W7DC70_9ACTN|nr:BTAD domain-containing putative transcriptional regulator [Sphaerisporangium siamense]MBB4704144.1 DNA-binding SARP family transcriptional activator/Flp pilus assembly protein TadD [Sphaerisporangium siamense]GII85175.1 SARP family transcriptional regulator [Sphaerisporangium siamense]
MEFRILGPLEVLAGTERLDIGGTRQRITLANLLLDANRVVTVDRLAEAIYGDHLPPTSRAQVQICISSLRRLFSAHGDPDVISTQSRGYIIRVADDAMDARRFEALTSLARRAREAGHLDEAVSRYREALALWRGEALEGIDGRPVQAAASRLNEERILTNEDCVQLELDLGRHQQLVGELNRLVEQYPLRERLRGQLMLALYRSGRRAEALRVYRLARETMIEELGIEPNEQLQRLEQAILTADDSLDAPPEAPIPAEPPPAPAFPVPGLLPNAIADFTGRGKQVDAIERELALAFEDAGRFAVPVIVITGKAGIGKTTVAVHAAHTVAQQFPFGQLFADLHGGGASRQVSAMQVLERFLRALGVPGNSIPDGLEERAEMYRALLADRRTLVVLDDAAGESHVLPLLPGTRSSAVIITSRSRLAGLAGAIHIDMDIFDADQSIELLGRIAGVARVRSEPDAARALAELCGQLPLALRIAGARLSARPHWRVEQLVSRLEDETRRLDELNHGEMGIRASISLTYESVGEEARRLFRRLAIPDTGMFSVWIGAALLDRSFEHASDLFDELADAQLIEAAGGGAHALYRFHDLIRVFARERLAAEETPAERKAALERVLRALLFLAEAAHRREYGGDYVQIHSDAPRRPLPARLVAELVAQPLPWYERERPLLVSGIRQAAQAGFTDLCWDLAISAVTLFESRAYLDDWRETHEIALAACRHAGDVRGQAAMLYSRGSLHITEKRFPEARRDFEQAIRLFTDIGDDQGTALVLRNIAFLERMSGRYEDAAAHYERALAMFTADGDQVGAAYVLHNLAQLRLETGDPEGASSLLSEALALSREGGSRRVESQVLHRMGDTYLAWGEPALAAEIFDTALAMVRAIGDPVGEAYILNGLGLARLRRGETGRADEALRHAVGLALSTGDRLAEGRALLGLGELALARDDAGHAVAHLERALGIFRCIRTPTYEARALTMLDGAQAALRRQTLRDVGPEETSGALGRGDHLGEPGELVG